MTTTTAIEETGHLTHDEERLVRALAGVHFDDLDAAAAWLFILFPSWYVYHGGSHLALHREKDDQLRIAIITLDPGNAPQA